MKSNEKNKNVVEEEQYDERGNLIYYKRSDGFSERLKYNKNGKLIYCQTRYPNGYIETEKYSDN